MVRAIGIALVLVTLSSCSSQKLLYNWASYEYALQRQYTADPDYVVEEDIRRLSEEMKTTRPEMVPPGKAAYLGYLHSTQGNYSVARDYFEMEKRLFPESKVFMDRILANAKRGGL